MTKRIWSVITLLFALAFAAGAQTAAATPAVTSNPPATTPSAVGAANLPSYTIGAGPSWTRGGSSPYSVDTTIGVHIGQTQWYSWTNISTPFTLPVVPGAPPAASTITTGGAWIPVQSRNGAVSLVFIVQAGFTMTQATSTAAPAFSGAAAVAIRLLKKTPLYLMPYAKTANASTSVTSGALATAVFQPGVQVMYGFGGK
jgi:hypothetical protein